MTGSSPLGRAAERTEGARGGDALRVGALVGWAPGGGVGGRTESTAAAGWGHVDALGPETGPGARGDSAGEMKSQVCAGLWRAGSPEQYVEFMRSYWIF